MNTQLMAFSVTGSGQLFSGGTRLRAYQVATSGAAAGVIELRDSSATGPVKTTIYLPANAAGVIYHSLPEMGLLFHTSLNCVVSGGAIVGLTAYVG